jgi:hypothetical protein
VTLEKLREVWWARPFVPFGIHLADGRSIVVRHPEFMAMAPSGRVFTVYDRPHDGQSCFDPFLVTEVERLPRASLRGRPKVSRRRP